MRAPLAPLVLLIVVFLGGVPMGVRQCASPDAHLMAKDNPANGELFRIV